MQNAEKLSVSMPLDMASDIRETVEAGEYASTSEAIRDAIRVWRGERLEDAERLTRIRSSLEDPRPNMTLKEVDARLAARFAEARRANGDGSDGRVSPVGRRPGVSDRGLSLSVATIDGTAHTLTLSDAAKFCIIG